MPTAPRRPVEPADRRLAAFADLDAIAALCGGSFATLSAWCRSQVAIREIGASGRPETRDLPHLVRHAIDPLCRA
jgi:hypothetical protein